MVIHDRSLVHRASSAVLKRVFHLSSSAKQSAEYLLFIFVSAHLTYSILPAKQSSLNFFLKFGVDGIRNQLS